MIDEQVRERVLNAADRLYYGRGIQSVGMDELRRASGVSLKGLYGVFPSKAAIVLEVLDRRHALWNTGVTNRVARADTPRAKLLAVYDYLSDWFSDDTFRGCGFINAFAELGSISPQVAERARKHKVGFQSFVARLVADDAVDPARGVPLHSQVSAVLRSRITDGSLPAGSLLPTEAELTERFGISRSVVRQALLALTGEGLVLRGRGRGSVVAPRVAASGSAHVLVEPRLVIR